DERGEFIRTQLAMERLKRGSPERGRLLRYAQELAAEHARAWLGELTFLLDEGNPAASPVHFVRGWLDVLRLPCLTVDVARKLTRALQTRMVRTLYIDHVQREMPSDYQVGTAVSPDEPWPGAALLFGSRCVGNVRCLHLRAAAFDPKEADVVLNSPHLRSLTHLTWVGSGLNDALCAAVVRSGLLR